MANNTIRQSQALHTYGPGAIGDFPEISVMFLSHDAGNGMHWGNMIEDNPKRRVVLYDKRLSDAFHVNRFVYPPIDSGVAQKNLISTIRFPFSLYCSNSRCGRIYSTGYLRDNNHIPNAAMYDLNQQGYICPDCYQNNRVRNKLIPTRFVIATEEGYIDDFPWDWYAHKDHPEQRGRGHQLYLKFTGSSSSLSSIWVESSFHVNGNRLKSTLEGVFDQEQTFMSRGNDYLAYTKNLMPAPWKGWRGGAPVLTELYKELISDVPALNWDNQGKVEWENSQNGTEIERRAKRKYPRTLQRGAGNLYFPVLFKAILLPLRDGEAALDKYKGLLDDLYDDILAEFLEDKLSELSTEDEKDAFDKVSFLNTDKRFTKIAEKFYTKQGEFTLSRDVYVKYLETKFRQVEDNTSHERTSRDKLRKDEFECFVDESLTEDNERWYKATHIQGTELGLLQNFVDKVVLLDKLNEIKIFRGFTRIRPLSNEDLIFETESSVDARLLNEFKRLQDARKDPVNTNELPCVDVKGEGIFIKFNDNVLSQWSSQSHVQRRILKLQLNVDHYDEVFHSESKAVNPRYVLLHSISHMLLRELSMDSGYSLSSLGEIIYCDSDGEENMNGILIYTSANDSEGTLGGLVEKGKPDYFEKLFIKALDRMKWCSSDPLCITTERGQGFMGLNLSACHACSLLPETACECMNKFLDRALLVGTLEDDHNSVGFFKGKLL